MYVCVYLYISISISVSSSVSVSVTTYTYIDQIQETKQKLACLGLDSTQKEKNIY